MRIANQLDLEIGRRLRQSRLVEQLTQGQLAQKIGISFQQLQKYENGSNRISASRLWSVSRALGLPITYFYDGLDDGLDDGQDNASAKDARSVNLPDHTIRVARTLNDLADGEVKNKLFELIRALANHAHIPE